MILRTENTEVEIIVSDEEYIGIGEIKIDGRLIKNSIMPSLPIIQTQDGFLFNRYKFISAVENAGEIIITIELNGANTLYCEDMDHSSVPYISLIPWNKKYSAMLEIHIISTKKEIKGKNFSGFKYYYTYKSDGGKIHQILDRQTWELDGTAVGTRILFQSSSRADVTFEKETRYATFGGKERDAEYSGSIVSGGDNLGECGFDSKYEIWYQTYCRFADSQCFDFFYKNGGILIGMYENMHDVNSLIYKEENEINIRMYDHMNFELSDNVSTVPKEILYAKIDEISKIDIDNMWTACYNYIIDKYRADNEVVSEKPIPFLLRNYWDTTDYRYHIESTLDMAEKLGYKAINIESCLESKNSQTEKPKYDNLGVVMNQCAVWDFKAATGWGGPEGLRELCDAAHKRGIEVHCWFNVVTTPGSPIHEKHPEWCLKKSAAKYFYGGGFDGHLIYLDLNAPGLIEYVLESMKTLKEQTGLDGLWHDSFCIGIRALNYADRTFNGQIMGALKLVKGLKNIGYKYYTETVTGVLGPTISSVGPNQPFAQTKINPFIYYDMCSIIPQDLRIIKEKKVDFDDFFRFMAYGSPISIGAGSWWGFDYYYEEPDIYMDILESIDFKDELKKAHTVFYKLRNEMVNREIDENGVKWITDTGYIYWATNDCTIDTATQIKLISEDNEADISGKIIKNNVYRIIK